MADTSHSLLHRLRSARDEDAWGRLDTIYRPLIGGWLRRRGVGAADAEDLAQEVMLTVLGEIAKFDHNGRAGAFRRWLMTITFRCLGAARRRKAPRPGADDPTLALLLDRLESDPGGLERLWDEEHDRDLVTRAEELARPEFAPRTWGAYVRLVHGGAEAADVAAAAGVQIGTVYSWKSQVVARLRSILGDLID